MDSLNDLDHAIDRAMFADRHRLRRQLLQTRDALKKGEPLGRRQARLEEELQRSIALCEARRANLPKISFDTELPVVARREEIAQAIRDHQVVIVCGETGSGKSTQLPKICLEMGRGIDGTIGHTQPRRIAARSVATRIAQELGTPLGQQVGFKVRFTDTTSPTTLVKLMTDGILLAEAQTDRFFNQYDTIILDEAHERSLNIDFLIGLLKRLLPKRRDLKVIITSATIDAARFAGHFASPRGPAPVIEVTGRTYPVDLRWRPVEPDEETGEEDVDRAVLEAVDELARSGGGDILIFMPTERDIHETAKALRGRPIPGDPSGRETDILPLYARLSVQEQQRVFEPHGRRRIVIATNVAESSLTVPGIRYVIDPGTARISRYSPRSKTQRLPIEAISQASADQRKGRCGRIGPGICIRLYSEEDYQGRDRFTAPEIQRTNLAAVILQTKAHQLGRIEEFPFLDPPRPDTIRDGYRTLFEIGALDENRELTSIGRRLSRLPVDPRIGRIILAGEEENCLAEMLIIAAVLEIQDPRDRPVEKQEAADQAHAQFVHPDSDFLGYLKLWDFYHKLKKELSRNQLRKACQQNFLSHTRMREWADIHRELLELVGDAGLRSQARRDDYDAIHRAVLTGLLSSLANRGEANEYRVAGGGIAHLWPGSGVFGGRPKWIVAAEVVETTRRYLRACARVQPNWIEPIAAHLVRRSYSNVRWDRDGASAVASEKVTLFGLTVVPGRQVRYGQIDPGSSRSLLIQHGLVEGEIDLPLEFLAHNQQLLVEMEQLQAKLRRHDLLLGEWARAEFYDRQLPAEVYDGAQLTRWLRSIQQKNPRALYMSPSDLLREDAAQVDPALFPGAIATGSAELPLDYRFEPGEPEDGVTLVVPVEALSQVDAARVGWLVPGLLEQKVLAMIRSLPKPIRRLLVPAPETAKRATAELSFGRGDIRVALAEVLGRLAGQRVPPNAFEMDRLPDELRMNLRVIDSKGESLSVGRNLEDIRRQVGVEAATQILAIDDPHWTRDGLRAWNFGDLPAEVEVRHGGTTLKAYPALIDQQETVAMRLADTPERALAQTRSGLRRLFLFSVARELKSQVDWLPGLEAMRLHAISSVPGDLRQQLVELLADRAFLEGQPPVHTQTEFERQREAGRQRIGLAVQDVLAIVPRLLESLHQAHLALAEVTNPAWQYAAVNVRAQLDALVRPGFLVATPWNWLGQYPRYFKAIKARLEALTGGGLIRDRRNFEAIESYQQAYDQRADQHHEMGINDPHLIHFRWMLEEYRVSLFAQKLGTAVPVSPKRLDGQWERVQ